jgi:hypothetical protein
MKKQLVITLLTMLVSLPMLAQQEKGDFQLQAQGSYYSIAGFDGGYIYLNASKFVTQNIEVGASPIISISTETTLNLAFFGNYSFVTKDAKLVPYVGAQLQLYNLGSEFGSQTGFGFRGGIRYFISEHVNIDVGPNITFLEGTSLFYFNAGLGFILPGGGN